MNDEQQIPPEVAEGERRAEQIIAATWFVDPVYGRVVYARNPFGDGNDFRVADVRGWGHLTGQSALAMDPAAAEITQMRIAAEIVDAHNNRGAIRP